VFTQTKAVIDLLLLRKQERKLDLETDKLRREQKKDTAMLQIATLEDILKFDPRARKIAELARDADCDIDLKAGRDPANLVLWTLLFTLGWWLIRQHLIF
jgi:hypothetical protein